MMSSRSGRARRSRLLRAVFVQAVFDAGVAQHREAGIYYLNPRCAPKRGWLTDEVYCASHGRPAGWPCAADGS